MKSHDTHDIVVVASCGCPLTEEHYQAIRSGYKNPNVKIQVVTVLLNEVDDLVTFLDARAKNEYVCVLTASQYSAGILLAAEKGLEFGFFENGADGRLQLYKIAFFCRPELVYEGRPKVMAMAATPGSEHYLP